MHLSSILPVLFVLFRNISTDPLTKTENEQLMMQCGKKMTTKILHGRDANQIEAPWSVFVQNRETVCTGSVVSSRHVFTATHCFAELGRRWEHIMGGTWDQANCKNGHYHITDPKVLNRVNIYQNGLKQVARSPERILLINACLSKNPTKKASDVYEDFAIVELYEDLNFSDTLQPACVSKNTNVPVGTDLDLYSFGSDPIAGVPLENDETTGKLRHESVKVLTSSTYIPEVYFFMTANPTNLTIACPGDSGGSAIQNINGRMTVVGVLSQTNCAKRGVEDIMELYTIVGYYNDFICGFTGICDSMDYDNKLAGYVRPIKPIRTTPPPIYHNMGADPNNVDSNNNSNNFIFSIWKHFTIIFVIFILMK